MGHFATSIPNSLNPWIIITSALTGLLLAVGAGLLHRNDGGTLPGSIKRAGISFTGMTTLAFSSMLTPQPLPLVAVMLAALLGGVAYGMADRADGATLPEAIWHGGAAFTSLAFLGFTFLNAYGLTHPS
ncbi:hypothetical protein [Streptomyces europaeiscabiei]|uniref:hypothetical protein n=1 Tax=Streptomyces europaeiscabiei TaxID=146819 RepID=UPI0029B58713|nr:hypothetical protein [Streptomyces europaeiscabiei]MDX3611932.1 hypothetical protein [Streptomyces europaeiscabiei]WUD33384.1 hypothetical protein OG858_19420 [Streptomyces europaeiscabiei]